MKKGILAAVIAGLAASVLWVGIAMAQDQQTSVPGVAKKDFSRLKVVAFSSGNVGFFDPDSGKLYVYDSTLESCVTVRQLNTLGAPLVSINQ